MKFFIHLIIISIFIASICSISFKLDEVRPDQKLQTFLYMAKNNQIKSFAFGFEAEYSDVLWMLSIQAFHKHCIDKIRFTEAEHVYRSIRLLDPHFKDMYETVPVYINMVTKQPSKGVSFVQEATEKQIYRGAKQPEKEYLYNQPWLWHLLARTYWIQRSEMLRFENIPREESMQKAILSLQHCIDLSENLWKKPFPEAEILMRFMVNKDKGFTLDVITWLEIYAKSSQNELLRTLVEEKIRGLIVDIHLEFLNEALSKYKKDHGDITDIKKISRFLKEPLAEEMPQIIAKFFTLNMDIKDYIIQQLNLDFPNGTDYFLDDYFSNEEEKVTSMLIQRRLLEQIISGVQSQVSLYYNNNGAFPESLEKMVETKYLPRMIKLPLGKKYDYNSENGLVSYTPKDEEK